jgi:hypothetical protein
VNRTLFAACAGLIAVCCAGRADAMAPFPTAAPPAPLSVEGQVTQIFQYDSNPLLVNGGARPVVGSTTEPEFTLTGATPTLRLDWDTRLDVNEFDRSRFSSTDVHTTARGTATGETMFAKLTAGFDYDTTRTSELTTSGFNVAGVRHDGLNLAPEIGAGLTPTDKILFDAGYQRATYDDTLLFTNYQLFSANPSFIHNFTDDDSGLVILQASRFETLTGVPGKEESVGAGLGWQSQISPRLNASISGGGDWTSSSSAGDGFFQPASSKRTIGYFYNLGLAYAGEQDSFHLSASRGLLPEGVAVETVQTSLRFDATHAFSPRIHASVSATYQKNSYSGSDGGVGASFFGGTAQYVEANASVSYQVTETVSLVPSIRYRDKEFVDGTTPANSRAALVTLVFKPRAAVLGW